MFFKIYWSCNVIDADVLEKPTFGYCGWKKYFELDKLDSIELIGFCTDICVISNALILKATFPNIDIFVNESCCAGTTTEQHNNAISVMRSCQIEIIWKDNAKSWIFLKRS